MLEEDGVGMTSLPGTIMRARPGWLMKMLPFWSGTSICSVLSVVLAATHDANLVARGKESVEPHDEIRVAAKQRRHLLNNTRRINAGKGDEMATRSNAGHTRST